MARPDRAIDPLHWPYPPTWPEATSDRACRVCLSRRPPDPRFRDLCTLCTDEFLRLRALHHFNLWEFYLWRHL